MIISRKKNLNFFPKKFHTFSLFKVKKQNFAYIWREIGDKIGFVPKRKQNKYDYVDLKFGSEARNILCKSIEKMGWTVATTYGPLGQNVAIGEGKDDIIVTKDGVTVAKHISFGNRKQQLGCLLLSSIAGNTNEYAGDGTTTSTVLAAEIVK